MSVCCGVCDMWVLSVCVVCVVSVGVGEGCAVFVWSLWVCVGCVCLSMCVYGVRGTCVYEGCRLRAHLDPGSTLQKAGWC